MLQNNIVCLLLQNTLVCLLLQNNIVCLLLQNTIYCLSVASEYYCGGVEAALDRVWLSAVRRPGKLLSALQAEFSQQAGLPVHQVTGPVQLKAW